MSGTLAGHRVEAFRIPDKNEHKHAPAHYSPSDNAQIANNGTDPERWKTLKPSHISPSPWIESDWINASGEKDASPEVNNYKNIFQIDR